MTTVVQISAKATHKIIVGCHGNQYQLTNIVFNQLSVFSYTARSVICTYIKSCNAFYTANFNNIALFQLILHIAM